MSKVNILLVDDHPGKLLSYQAILDDLGENLVLAHSGKEALQHLLREEFALILMDVVMPEMDGFETAALIRQHPRLEDTPIIFVTALSTSDLDRLRGYELGAVDYVFAPVVSAILRAKVGVFVELHRKRRELSEANAQLRIEVAERKRAQEQALQAERLAAIGEMVTGLAHESRNALQLMQASLEMLERRVPPGMERDLIAEIQKGQDRLHSLFEDVRNYAAPIRLALELHDVSTLWREAWRQLGPTAGKRDVQLTEEINGASTKCLVDPFRLEHVFRNILENSLAACPDPVRITVHCDDSGLGTSSALRVRIRDNGPGLGPEQRSRIFDPFFTTKVRGTGLGMAIARRIVEAHGGAISVADHPPPGAELELVLPRGIP